MRYHWTRKILWISVAVLLVGMLAPLLVSVNFWHGRILAALSRGLGRPVRAGAIHLKLFGGPGFEIDSVVVEEDSRFGIEPLARMENLQATLGLRSLWQWKMEFSSLAFVRPSLNVVRNTEGRWNLESLWGAGGFDGSRLAVSGEGKRASEKRLYSLPRIQITGGRINFKSENRKTVYTIDAVEMEIAPPSSPNLPWRLRFEGRPNRTDSLLNSVSRFRGQAELGPFSPREATQGVLTKLDLVTEDALVSDFLNFFSGNDYGVHGSFTGHLHFAGTTSLLQLTGTANVKDLHRWDRLPPAAASRLHGEIAGILNLERQFFELRSLEVPVSRGVVLVQGEVEQLFRHPQPRFHAQLRRVPLAGVIEIAKQFTNRLDPRLSAEGSLEGYLEAATAPGTLHGNFSISGATVQLKGTRQSARLSDFRVTFDASAGKTTPLTIDLGKGGQMGSSLEWDLARVGANVRLEGDGVRLDSFLPWARALGSRWGQANFAKGNLSMHANISARVGKPAEITGWAQISDAVLNSAAINQPLRIPAARLQFQPGQVKVKPFSAAVGPVELQGSVIAKIPLPEVTGSTAVRPSLAIEFDVQSPDIDISDLDRLLNPHYRQAAFFRFPRAADAAPSNFFASLMAQGTVQTGTLSYRGNVIRNFKSAVDFRDRTLHIKTFTGEFAGGPQNGKATIRFGLGAPDFSLQTRFSKLDLNQVTRGSASWGGFFAGKLSGTLRLAGYGWNLEETLDHLGGSGETSGTNLELNGLDFTHHSDGKSGSVAQIASFAAVFQISKKEVLIKELRMVPSQHIGLRQVSTEQKPAEVVITGSVGFDRALDLVVTEKSTGAQAHHWGGTLADPLVGETAALLRSTAHSGSQ